MRLWPAEGDLRLIRILQVTPGIRWEAQILQSERLTLGSLKENGINVIWVLIALRAYIRITDFCAIVFMLLTILRASRVASSTSTIRDERLLLRRFLPDSSVSTDLRLPAFFADTAAGSSAASCICTSFVEEGCVEISLGCDSAARSDVEARGKS